MSRPSLTTESFRSRIQRRIHAGVTLNLSATCGTLNNKHVSGLSILSFSRCFLWARVRAYGKVGCNELPGKEKISHGSLFLLTESQLNALLSFRGKKERRKGKEESPAFNSFADLSR